MRLPMPMPMQSLVADKDAELARQYKRMEKEASERSGLRNQYTSALDEVKALRSDLEEARQAMLDLKVSLSACIHANTQLDEASPQLRSGLVCGVYVPVSFQIVSVQFACACMCACMPLRHTLAINSTRHTSA